MVIGARALLLLCLGMLQAGWVVADTAPITERVRFASLQPGGAVVMLDAVWMRPAGSEGRALPAVIALHGCGGLYAAARSPSDRLSARHQRMAEMLLDEGYVVLFPDSFRRRGVEEICTQSYRDRTINQQARTLDVLGALQYLQGRPDVQSDRIALLGWSHGGSTVLAAMNAANAMVRDFRQLRAALPYVRTAIAFYPGCGAASRASDGYRPAAPLLLLVGGADDWTPPGPCIDLVERLRRNAEPASIVVYPDTFHGFDGPGNAARRRVDVPNGVRPGQGVTVATNPQARADAYERVRGVLRAALASVATGDRGRPLMPVGGTSSVDRVMRSADGVGPLRASVSARDGAP
ncbi:MAG: dienelactone hydrolase family protein [Casimicrobiaceae bacterium]